MAGDPCWLVRYVLASNVGKICDNLPDDVLPKNIQTVTLNLPRVEEVRWDERLRTPDPTKCTMSGPGLKTGEVHVPQTFTVQAKNSKGEHLGALRAVPGQHHADGQAEAHEGEEGQARADGGGPGGRLVP